MGAFGNLRWGAQQPSNEDIATASQPMVQRMLDSGGPAGSVGGMGQAAMRGLGSKMWPGTIKVPAQLRQQMPTTHILPESADDLPALLESLGGSYNPQFQSPFRRLLDYARQLGQQGRLP